MTRILLMAATLLGVQASPQASRPADPLPQAARPTFRSGIEVVRVTAVVEDRDGRPVLGLSRGDFELFDGGIRRPILEFTATPSPITLAILVDGSGSMRVSPARELMREAVHHVLSWIEIGQDEAALYAFDSRVRVVESFTSTPSLIAQRVPGLEAFGQTSIYDAIAETSRALAARGRARGAVVVVTDGVDTSSVLGGAAVSELANAIDVPVYILALANGVPASSDRASVPATRESLPGLHDLSRSTGGRLLAIQGPASASLAARAVISELRHQYLIGFEPDTRAGWHPLTIRTRQNALTVRARNGYLSGASSGSQ